MEGATVANEAPADPSLESSIAYLAKVLGPNHAAAQEVYISRDGRVLPRVHPSLSQARALLATVAGRTPGGAAPASVSEAAQSASFGLLALASESPDAAAALVALGALPIALGAVRRSRPGTPGAAPWSWIGPCALAARLLDGCETAREMATKCLAAAGLPLAGAVSAAVHAVGVDAAVAAMTGASGAEQPTYALRLLALHACAQSGASAWLPSQDPTLACGLVITLADVAFDSPCPTLALAATTLTASLARWGGHMARLWLATAGVVDALGDGLTAPSLLPIRRAAAAAALESLYVHLPGCGADAALTSDRGLASLADLLQLNTPYAVGPARRVMLQAARDPQCAGAVAAALDAAMTTAGHGASSSLVAVARWVLMPRAGSPRAGGSGSPSGSPGRDHPPPRDNTGDQHLGQGRADGLGAAGIATAPSPVRTAPPPRDVSFSFLSTGGVNFLGGGGDDWAGGAMDSPRDRAERLMGDAAVPMLPPWFMVRSGSVSPRCDDAGSPRDRRMTASAGNSPMACSRSLSLEATRLTLGRLGLPRVTIDEDGGDDDDDDMLVVSPTMGSRGGAGYGRSVSMGDAPLPGRPSREESFSTTAGPESAAAFFAPQLARGDSIPLTGLGTGEPLPRNTQH